MRAAFYTLGCKVNQNETGALEELFRRAGPLVVAADAPAAIGVVDSCTVTAGGDAKSRRALAQARRRSPGVVTVLTGCSPQAFPAQSLASGADVITGTAQRGRLLRNIQRHLDTGERIVDIAPLKAAAPFEELPAAPLPGRTRAFVKIQDGCNRRCAYCIIPAARGPARSRGAASILAEVQALAANGYTEVVFTGINLPSYGRDTGTNLADITEAAAGVAGIGRIRLSSLDPDLLDDAQIGRFAACGKLCPHFHLSLQSGCDATLRRMRRPYTAAQYAAVAQKLRRAMPGASLTTDVIAGFPGESEADFGESLAFVREMNFLKVHVFPFSPREGTPAAALPGQLTKAEKAARAKTMQQAADAVRQSIIAAQEGALHRVLLEAPLPSGPFSGYTENYIPAQVTAPGAAAGQTVRVKLGAFDGARCRCTLAQENLTQTETR